MTATTGPTIDAFAFAHTLDAARALVAGGRGLAGTDPLLAGWAEVALLTGHGTADRPAA